MHPKPFFRNVSRHPATHFATAGNTITRSLYHHVPLSIFPGKFSGGETPAGKFDIIKQEISIIHPAIKSPDIQGKQENFKENSRMAAQALSPKIQKEALKWQRAEITGHYTYMRLAEVVKDPNNRKVVQNIGLQESAHYKIFKSYTKEDTAPNWFQVWIYYWIARILGLTFGIKLMERGEEWAQLSYQQFRDEIPEIEEIIRNEEEHENKLLAMLDEEVLKYTGSVVLGLNDALVELTGALAGLTFAFQNTRLIAVTGLITGVSAALSMAASEYLSTRAENGEASPGRSALYTGIAYIFTVIVLILPFFLLQNYLACLAWTLLNAILIIALFNFYISVAKDLEFGKRFLEMAAVSVSVAAFSFGIGYLVRQVFGIDI